jgi:membrane protease YdiL (CAAX protease family)
MDVRQVEGLPMQSGTARVAAALVAVAVWAAITINFGRDWGGPNRPLDDTVNSGFAWQIFWAGAFIFAVVLVLRWRDVGLNAPKPHTLHLLWLPAIFIAAFFVGAVVLGLPPLPVVGIILLNAAMVGWSEELAFRGVLFSALRTTVSIWPAMLLSSILFGSIHVLNGFGTGDWSGAVVQAVSAAMSGLLFVAILIRTGSIIPAMVVHALWDGGLFLMTAAMRDNLVAGPAGEPSSLQFLLPIAFDLPNFLFALWLLRKVRSAPG